MKMTLSSTIAKVSSAMSGLYNRFLGQTQSQARLNAIASYDQSNELFKAFLSKDMVYSCALWSQEEGGIRGDLELGPMPGDLEAAQRRKLHHVLRAARVKRGDRILEFGSGWGGLAIEVRHYLPPRVCSAAKFVLSVGRLFLGLRSRHFNIVD
jgi:cyclopropane-fatty-acyl-phospholipid synthase